MGLSKSFSENTLLAVAVEMACFSEAIFLNFLLEPLFKGAAAAKVKMDILSFELFSNFDEIKNPFVNLDASDKKNSEGSF